MDLAHPLLNEVDTVRVELKFQKNPNKFYDFNYVVMSEEIGHVYIDEGFFELIYFHPSISISVIFLMLVSDRSFYLVYQVQLKSFLYEVK